MTIVTKYHNMSISELYSLLDGFMSDDEIAIREGSRVIQAMAAKGERPDIAKVGPFKFWKQICDESLHPRAAIMLNAFPKVIAELVKLDRDMQEALANGRSIDVAVINGSGEVTRRALRILQIPQKTLAVMVKGGKIASVDDIEAALLADYKPKSIPQYKPVTVQANTGANTVTIGGAEVDAARLAEALIQLGFKVTK